MEFRWQRHPRTRQEPLCFPYTGISIPKPRPGRPHDIGCRGRSAQHTSQSGLPLPTIHRLVRTLVDLGYVRQEPSREYALGPRLVRLGDISSGLLTRWATPYLQKVVDALGESTNLAILDGDQIMYVAQAPGSHSMRMFTEVGRRAQAHCTAVGKAMLAQLPAEKVDGILRRSGMPAMTEHTIT